MKGKKLVIGFLFISILIFSIINSRGRSKTIEEALGIGIYNNAEIIHEEKTDKGSIVFGINYDSENDRKGFFTAFLNRNIFGYKDFYSGVAAIENEDSRDLTNSYFPAIKKTSLPIYFGLILNEEIEKITVNESTNDEIKEAKIIEEKGQRIWLVYMKGFKGTEFEITGYNKKGEVISKLEETTTPWAVEQEPMESPYK